MVQVAGRSVTSLQVLDRAVDRIIRDGRVVFTSGSGGGGTAPGHYVHTVWGDTSKLTPPPALQGNYLRITDIDRGKDSGADPDGQLWEENGGDGQLVRGGWITCTLNEATSLVPGGRIYVVVIDGGGADVWIDHNRDGGGNPRPDINYHVHIQNCRVVRITGVKQFVDDVRKVSGGHPDSGSAVNMDWHGMNTDFTFDPVNAGGFEECFVARWMNNDSVVFVEGCDIDLNHGGVVQSFRTDAFATNNWGTDANGAATSIMAFQNTRVVNVASDLADSHADILHVQANATQRWACRWLHFENFVGTSKYQGVQINYAAFHPDGTLDTRAHCRHYRSRIAKDGSGGTVPLLTIGNGADDVDVDREDLMPSIEFESSWLAKQGAPFWPNTISNNNQNPTMTADYHNARANIERYMDYGDGDVQDNMSNADANRDLVGLHFAQNNNGTLPVTEEDVVPVASIGDEYVSLWSADGGLLTEEGETTWAQVSTDPDPLEQEGGFGTGVGWTAAQVPPNTGGEAHRFQIWQGTPSFGAAPDPSVVDYGDGAKETYERFELRDVLRPGDSQLEEDFDASYPEWGKSGAAQDTFDANADYSRGDRNTNGRVRIERSANGDSSHVSDDTNTYQWEVQIYLTPDWSGQYNGTGGDIKYSLFQLFAVNGNPVNWVTVYATDGFSGQADGFLIQARPTDGNHYRQSVTSVLDTWIRIRIKVRFGVNGRFQLFIDDMNTPVRDVTADFSAHDGDSIYAKLGTYLTNVAGVAATRLYDPNGDGRETVAWYTGFRFTNLGAEF